MDSDNNTLPTNFRTLVADFVNDLTRVFPEYDIHWRKYADPDISDNELHILLDHCSKVYPERFFDILYQNEEIFEEESRINTDFLPKMSFKYLYNCEGVSENSKKILWKYLQLMLFTVVGNVDNKETFGDTSNIFDGIDENVLQEKLQETMSNITDVFEGLKESAQKKSEEQGGEGETTEEIPNMPSFEGMPNLENLQSHLKTLFDGKIGKLAKELAEEVADEFKEVVGVDAENPGNAQDIIKNLMKNPAKIKNLMKTVSSRLDEKMKSGEISRDDIVKEAGQFLNEMKNTRGEAGMNDMLKSMMKNMGGLGKNAKINKNALNKLMKQSENKERILQKAKDKKEQKLKEEARIRKETLDRIREQNRLKAQYNLTKKDNENEFVFKINGEDVQEKSFIHPDLLEEIKKEEEQEKEDKESGNKKKKKKKKKKSN
tara:strand:+ start:65 stop:1360 length:1296 start_codon:yes stop_codon:yes gene_type:complete